MPAEKALDPRAGDDMTSTMDTEIGLETRKLWMTTLLAAPGEWRGRAATLAGLFSAAAAASIAGLLIGSAEFDEPLALNLMIAAVIAYVLSITALISATVFPNPRVGKYKTKGSEVAPVSNHSFTSRSWCFRKIRHPRKPLTDIALWTDWAEAYALAATKPLRDLTLGGSALGAAAVCAGFLATLLPTLLPLNEAGLSQISILRPQVLNSIEQACPGAGGTFPALIASTTSESTIEAVVAADLCDGQQVTFTLLREDVLVAQR